MEQVHYHWAEEEEEEEQQQLQHGKDNIIATALQPSFSSAPTNNAVSSPSASVGEQPLLQNEQVQVPHTHKVEETSNVAEHAYHFNDDSEAVGLGIVAEFVENVAASQNEISVYFDKQQGMWKCHHCTWTKQFDSPWNVALENLNGYSDLLMNVKTMILHGPCFLSETKVTRTVTCGTE
ncbi:hypothetical protein CR513_51467, partial [Mucuna pruriens]